MTKRVYFVRHAESTANAGHKTNDPADIALTDKGREQSLALVDRWDVIPSVIVTSRFIRTIDTARPTIDKFPDVPHETWDVHEFTYINSDRCQNMSQQDRLPIVTEYWGNPDPNHNDGNDAESFNDFFNRCQDFIQQVKDSSYEKLFVFTHQQFITAIRGIKEGWLCEASPDNMRKFRQDLFDRPVPNAVSIEYHF